MMSAVATNSVSSCIKRDRSSSDDSDVGSLTMKKKPRYFYILEPETTDYSSDEIDSVHSIQQQTTDSAKDTSDTSSKSEDSMVEFEVVSNSDDPVYPFPSRDSSSPPDDILSGAISFEFEERFFYSGSDACESSSVTSGKGRSNRKLSLFKTCVQCGQGNNGLFYRYCDKCYKVRKNFFPPRPVGRKKRESKKMVDISKTADDVIRSSCDSGIYSAEYTPRLSEKPLEERLANCAEQDKVHRKEMCGTCLVRFKDGGFVHNNIVHVYSCYRCSVKTIKQIGRCPICNVRVRQVCKVITI